MKLTFQTSEKLDGKIVDLIYVKLQISVRSNNLSLKYQRFTPSVCKIQGFENFGLRERLNYRFEICLQKVCLLSFRICRFHKSCLLNSSPEIYSIPGTLLEDKELLELVEEWEKKERGSLPSYVEICIIVWQGDSNIFFKHKLGNPAVSGNPNFPCEGRKTQF